MAESKPYQQEEWLREQYYGEGRTVPDIADEFGMTATGISYWMDKYGLDRRGQREAQLDTSKPYTDREWLAEQYKGVGRSMANIGKECDVTAATILKWLRRFGIQTRGEADHVKQTPAAYVIHGTRGDIPGGYIYSRSSHGPEGEREHYSVAIHQLIAIAEGADPHKVFSNGDYHCHHKNGIRWDNRPDNIEFLSVAEHRKRHTQ